MDKCVGKLVEINGNNVFLRKSIWGKREATDGWFFCIS
jgi:hypothetical protein